MERLTHERVNGIKSGYWSAATKEFLVQRLAEYENTGLDVSEIRELRNYKAAAADQIDYLNRCNMALQEKLDAAMKCLREIREEVKQ